MKAALESYSKYLVAAQDYRDAELTQLESSVLPVISKMNHDCKAAKQLRWKLSLSGSETKLNQSGRSDDLNKTTSSLDGLARTSKNETDFINFERGKLMQMKVNLMVSIDHIV